MSFRRRAELALALACCLAAAVVVACRPGRSPVGDLEVEPATLALDWPNYTEVRIRFRPTRELPAGAERPVVFFHLLDEPGSVVRTFDHPLPGAWQPGREVDYRYRLLQSALAEPLPAGEYLLSIGLYTPELGRFALRTGTEEIAKLEYQVATVRVRAPDESAPRARFSAGWLPPEAEVDRQILGRRTLSDSGPGTVQFGPLAAPGTLYVQTEIPGPGADGVRLELEPGEEQPKLRVVSSCGGNSAEVSGAGTFDLDLALPGGGATCELTFTPNFQVRRADRAEVTSARLSLLAWRAESAPTAHGATPP